MAAVLGLFIVALLISYLPTIYGLFSRREVTVADVSIKSGGTAHGPDLVLHLTRVADTARLDDMWVDWGHWLITLGETHTSEPSLNFYRSPRVHRSWLNAATAILDAAALRNTVVAAPFSIRAEMTYRSGVEALAGIAHFFFVRPETADDHYSLLTRDDFDAEVARLEADAVPVVETSTRPGPSSSSCARSTRPTCWACASSSCRPRRRGPRTCSSAHVRRSLDGVAPSLGHRQLQALVGRRLLAP